MSHEYVPGTADSYRQNRGRSERLAIIESIDREVDKKLEIIEIELYKSLRNPHQAFGSSTLRFRSERLAILSQETLDMAEYENGDGYVLVDDISALEEIDRQEPDQGSLHHTIFETHREALAQGQSDGTGDFLELIVPEKFTDKSLREVYFSAWSKDIITKRFPDGLSETSDGGMRLYLGTRLPNVIMEYAYAKDKKLPTRRLLLAPRMNG